MPTIIGWESFDSQGERYVFCLSCMADVTNKKKQGYTPIYGKRSDIDTDIPCSDCDWRLYEYADYKVRVGGL